MNSVKFGDKDSYKDWGLLLKTRSRPFPVPKTNNISIEGRDGDLDLTASLTGDVKYKNVTDTLNFFLLDNRKDWEEKMYEISTYLHGKKMNVVFSEDPDWYCIGRMTVDKLTSSKNIGTIAIKCDFQPYRMKKEETVVTETVTANKTITLSNSRKWVMPTIKASSSVVFEFEDKQYSTSSTLETPEFILKEGDNLVKIISGSGTISFTYREGKL